MSKVGILGGSFDPIHNEHINFAKKTQKLLNLDKIYFSISLNPPHKTCKTPFFHRYTMLNLAINRYEKFFPLAMELESENLKYTINLLKAFSEKYKIPKDNIFFLAGGDSLKEIDTWREYERLLKNYRFVFVIRKNIPITKETKKIMKKFDIIDLRGEKNIKKEIERYRSILIDINLKDISSTKIRNMLKSNLDVRDYIPFDTFKYIKKNGVYGRKN